MALVLTVTLHYLDVFCGAGVLQPPVDGRHDARRRQVGLDHDQEKDRNDETHFERHLKAGLPKIFLRSIRQRC